MKIFLAMLMIITILPPAFSQQPQKCLNVDGLQFEKIDRNKLLVIQAGKNIAIVETITAINEKPPLMFRFFTPTLCEWGVNHRFHINGTLYEVTGGGWVSVFRC